MTNYKKYGKTSIGSSDYATLIIASPEIAVNGGMVRAMALGFDGSYSAYIVDAECEIPAHYTLWSTSKYWLKIYDDEGLTFRCNADKINIYRSGNGGVIIQTK